MHPKNNSPEAGLETRREFMSKAAKVAAAVATVSSLKTPVYGQNQAPSANVTGANNRLVVAYIGVGGQGMAHVRAQKEHAASNNIVQAAVCDVWKNRVESAKSTIGGDCQGYDDHRKLLERKDIDAVTISTVDHWHAPCAIDAMNAGKHVFVEKPMTRYLDEAWKIHDTCKKTKKILQVGSQGCADAKWHKTAELIKAGKIGPLVLAQGSYMRNNHKGEWNYKIEDTATPETLDWKRWLGTQIKKKIEFNPDHYFRWRKYYPYCAGLLGDLFPHRLHPLMLATGNPEYPTRVCSVGNKKIGTDKLTPGTYERDVPENVQLLAEFPSGMTMFVTSATVNEQGLPDMIRGHKATLTFGGNRVELKPERPFTDEIEPQIFENLKPGESVPELEKNWFNCIRSGEQPFAGIELAMRVQTVISLAEMSERLSIMCLYDEKTRKIRTGDGKEVKPMTYGSTELS